MIKDSINVRYISEYFLNQNSLLHPIRLSLNVNYEHFLRL